jgi:cytoskeletal protein RodZ
VRVVAGALAVVLMLGGVFWIRAHRTTSSNPVTTTTATTAQTTNPTQTPTGTTPTVPTTPTTSVAIATASSSAGETRAVGHLALYGDPGTRVLVDGVSRGSCPLPDVTVEPGEHDVRFVFDVTGDKIDTRVRVKASEHVKLRADFTGATPAVRVQH